MSFLTNNYNLITTSLNNIAERENLNYISKFGLAASIVQYIDLYLIFYIIYIDGFIIALNVELNL